MTTEEAKKPRMFSKLANEDGGMLPDRTGEFCVRRRAY